MIDASVLVEALQALATANHLGRRRHPSRSLWPRAWELQSNLSAYDALYVALAEQLDAPLLPAQGRLKVCHMVAGMAMLAVGFVGTAAVRCPSLLPVPT